MHNSNLPYATEASPKMFSSPLGAAVQEKVPYPAPSLTLNDLLDDEAVRCIAYVAHRNGIELKELLSGVVKEWYDVHSDESAEFLRRQIALSKIARTDEEIKVAMQTKEAKTQRTARETRKHMTWGDYALVYFTQSLPLGEKAPDSSAEMVERFGQSERRPELDAAKDAASELFGMYSNSPLYEVTFLTLEEGKIASRLDLTHAEKMELIRPLREKRERNADKRSAKLAQELSAEREERISAAVVETMAISDDDRSWASELKIKLD